MATIRPVFAFGRQKQKDRGTQPEGSIPVSVEGSAKSLQAFLEFERALIQDPHFDHIEPHRFNRGEANEVVFEMRFLYFPEADGHAPAVPEEQPAASQEVADGVVELPKIEEEEPPAADVVEVEEPGPVTASEELTEVVLPDDAPLPAASPVRQGPGAKGRRSGRRDPEPNAATEEQER